jgi:hypothetical protein
MTTSSFTSRPLLTDADVLRRVREIVGEAIVDARLWLFLVDGDGVQLPTLIPIDDVPRRPDGTGLPGLGAVLEGIADQLVTDIGPGSVVLTLERLGPGATVPDDRAWAAALTHTCAGAGMSLRGVFLATTAGIRRLA